MNIVCIGDSLTFGYGVKASESWVSVLSVKLGMKIINKGVPGNTTTEMKNRFIKDVINCRPDKVLIMGGTNDLFLKGRVSDVVDNIALMIEHCKKHKIEPIILTSLPVNEDLAEKTWFTDMDYKKINADLTELRHLLIQYSSEKSVTCLDIGTHLLEEGTIRDHFLEDGIHVSEVIHKRVAEIIFESIF
ncbi:GDSL-type esterase/lipase family protein [Fusibacter ferrireducens]|uniref:SGNH hydrolase-type esterase domain-containing protein n=1 Tax=Fusibacter ferrireducens TaxID=2785058 RepID=A0ABR9ZVA1_9FIRM|nr:GDSL-type esterase/lipase family protein [Fusibacter ferrireducens]MBF4694391.1 hypothetical protein [Fusibacter ferrireducens]